MIRWLRAWALRLASLAGVGRSDRDIDEELATHRALLEADYRRSGLSDDDARRAAAAAFGPITPAAAAYRDRRGIRPFEDLVDDAFETLRSLVRSPSRLRRTISIVALLSVCLIVGSCIFAIVDGVLLKPLAVHDPDRLFIAGPPNRLDPSRPSSVDLDDLDVLAHTAGVDGALAYDFAPDRDKDQTRPDRERHVSASFFSTLGVTPLLGRALAADDAGSSPRAVVIGYGLWRSALGGDPNVIGRSVAVGDDRVLVRGVMPRGFDFPRATTIWSLAPPASRRPNGMRMRSMTAVVRLAPGVTPGVLRLSDDRVVSVPLAQYLRPGGAWSILPVSIAALFMIAMGLAHLVLAQTTHAIARAKEIAIRIALGSGWTRIARQWLCENAWLTIAAVGIAAAAAPATLTLLIRLLPAELTFGQPIAIDHRVEAVAGVIALATLAALTIASLVALRGATLTDLLRGRLTRAGLALGPRAQTVVLAVQVAVVTSLVYVGTLALQSFMLADRASLGVETDGLIAVDWHGDLRRGPSSSAAALRKLAARVRQVPDVVAVAHGPSPLEPDRLILQLSATPVRTGAEARAMPLVDVRGISANYFTAARIPLLDGRAFDSSDEEHDVAIVSHAFAAHFFPYESPVGRALYDGAPTPLQIVGVVGDVRVMGPEAPPREMVYLPSGAVVGKSLGVRLRRGASSARLTDISAIVRDAVADAGTVAVVDVAQQRDRLLDGQRARATLLGVLGIVSFGLGLAGVVAMAGESVQRGLRDAAIRLALGAVPSRVVRHLVSRVLSAVAIGLAGGLAGGFGAARWAASIFYGVQTSDPATLVVVAVIVSGGATCQRSCPRVARRARTSPASSTTNSPSGTASGRLAKTSGRAIMGATIGARYTQESPRRPRSSRSVNMTGPSAPSNPSAPDLDAIKTKQRATWSSGNYAIIGTTLQIVGESLCEAVDLRSGSTVLDVAAGNGNCSLAAARRWCDVTSTDYVPALLEEGRRRAEAEHLSIRFQEADAEALPFADASFDAVLSSFGIMFAPNHARVASELARVCRSNGRIGLANWTPEGFVGRLFAVVGRHVPPPAGLTPPARWGTREHLQELFGASASAIHVNVRTFTFRYRSPEHWVEVFRAWYGPTHRAFASLSTDAQAALERDLLELIATFNVSGDSTMVVPGEYLEVVIVKK